MGYDDEGLGEQSTSARSTIAKGLVRGLEQERGMQFYREKCLKDSL